MFLKKSATVPTLTRSLSFAVLYFLLAAVTHPLTQVVLTSHSAAAAEPATVASTKRVHHYVFFGGDRESIPNAKSFLDTEAFEGAQVSYSWRQIEHTKDEYDFSEIRQDLKLLNARGKKLWIQFQDVTFSPKRINAPKYLLEDPQFNGGVDKQYQIRGDDESQGVHEGWMVRRYDPAVQERLYKLFAALGKEFDGRIEGINLAETSGGFGWTGKLFPKGYSPEKYRDAIVANIKALKRAFPKSIAMVYANFMPGGRANLEAVYKAARESNIAVGGPDLMPFRPFQLSNSYPLIRESAGVVPTGLAVQDGNYSDVDQKTGKRATVEGLLKFGKEDLKLDYIFWCTEEPYYSQELIPFMRSANRS